MDNNSEDLFSSQNTSQGTNINEQIDITLQLTEFVWVQCDHPYCQKWRRIPTVNADNLKGDDPWYCSMNPDPSLNFCDAKEEDHRKYDRMAKKVGVKFVMSELQIGSLVWAKMAGYCRWPGIVTPDPMTGVHIHLDIDGDPHSYHVEYLGNPHTHSWVVAKYVEVYGHKEEAEEVINREVNKIGKKKYSKKSKITSLQIKNKTSYRRMKVEDVMREADNLLRLGHDERMKFCVFTYDPKFLGAYGLNDDVTQKCNNCGEDPVKKKKRKLDNQTVEGIQNLIHLRGQGRGKDTGPRISETRRKSFSMPRLTKVEETNKSSTNIVGPGKRMSMPELSALVQKYDKSIKPSGTARLIHKDSKKKDSMLNLSSPAREVSMVELSAVARQKKVSAGSITESPNQFSQSKLKISSSMIDKTKEEKFKIDIDVYMKNEKAFEHDVRRFMTRNDRTIRASPLWHNVPVSLFQLYLAVHERGGFKKVCDSKAWTRVYKELTDMQHVTTGTVAKHYYERNLYPYELFISGKDYSEALEKFNLKPGKKSKQLDPVIKQEPDPNNNTENVTSDYASYCSDIDAILGQLEEDYNAVVASNESKNEMKQKIGVSLTFHDETPSTASQKYASVPSEFDQRTVHTDSDASTAQKVPGYDMKEDDLGLDDEEEMKILTEMKALEDQMREMHDEIDDLI